METQGGVGTLERPGPVSPSYHTLFYLKGFLELSSWTKRGTQTPRISAKATAMADSERTMP